MSLLRITFAALIGVFGVGGLFAEELQTPPADTTSVSSINAFAFELYPDIAEADGQNVFFSPYSVYAALTMVAEGAVDQTAEQMASVLKFPTAVGGRENRTQQAHVAMAGLARSLRETDPDIVADARKKTNGLQSRLQNVQQELTSLHRNRNYREALRLVKSERQLIQQLEDQYKRVKHYEFLVANTIWAEQSYSVNDAFSEVLKRYYGTGKVMPVDFRHHHNAARIRINDWAAKQTKDRVKDLLPEGTVEPTTRLVLANAVYFQGDWAEPFQEKRTRNEDFHSSPEVTKTVAMMINRGHKACRYAAFQSDGRSFDTPRKIPRGQTEGLYPAPDGFSLIELPYDGDRLSMVLAAPQQVDGLPKLERMLTAERWQQWMSALDSRKTHVYVPKFRMQTEYDLGTGGVKPTGVLPSMGMGRAFTDPATGQGAQFDRISASGDPKDKLYIGVVRHKAFLEINEQGTEAAAATAVVMMEPTSAAPPVDLVDFIPTFRADRPFVCAIQDRDSGAILFLGRVTNPSL